ncbi:hypothetical protein [Paraburkholderia terricola]|uniref:Uncharacterized protein n=1 Tax=Paraburkholderia terricola TaxID=169427 RepID=A0ABU1LZW3_9BURK|nr:hypothetical protein [Paraburkholderia terricola]MDR6412281.1 hypothetical protein [Paraburkholderia terricola]MDR6484655.1 hypothetical protein [Paraburkholderia terricola]
MMKIPRNIPEALSMGGRRATTAEIAAMKAHADTVFHEDAKAGDLCYCGPCINGERTCCYFTDNGCTDDGCMTVPCNP